MDNKEIIGKSDSDLKKHAYNKGVEISRLRISISSKKEKNYSKLSIAKKERARVLTEMAKRNIYE